ncbi:hypothetical protein J8A87_22740 [Vibrio parahaemolyticus]|uniref:hypothetical protein n=1 Tax=Vibrio parahaemolyticus TaxID=670 RepID=UPI00280838AC|nr:hypothetical protein [Vibrio parahaemolyticus]ELA8197241.1 hypothetical protein [Vibrio parahaemolyticus]MBE4779952.1 hypothetical protein [Vibrio parahaemolyticus]MCF9167270.1 hypothetical protein [Vibrio parahaemolyticus]MDG3410415.1 hypothetical protein [Vibrio parahaemolyticus]
MKLNVIVEDKKINVFLVVRNDDIASRLLNDNRNLVASTNIDVSTINSSCFESLESLGGAMNELAVSQLSHKLKQLGENQDSIKGFVDKFEMCHRGTVPTICLVNRYSEVIVLSFSDRNADEFNVTKFFKINQASKNNVWQHSFEVQSKSIHIAHPSMYSIWHDLGSNSI